MLNWIISLFGGDKMIAKYIGSFVRHLIPPITAYLLALGIAPELVDTFVSHLDLIIGSLASLVVAIAMSLREKSSKE